MTAYKLRLALQDPHAPRDACVAQTLQALARPGTAASLKQVRLQSAKSITAWYSAARVDNCVLHLWAACAHGAPNLPPNSTLPQVPGCMGRRILSTSTCPTMGNPWLHHTCCAALKPVARPEPPAFTDVIT